MKKALITATLLACSVPALADKVKLVNADGSPLGQLCIAAVESDKSLSILANELGLHATPVDEVYCNGKPIRSFAQQLQGQQSAAPAAAAAAAATKRYYMVSLGDQSPETQLCLAALTSDAEFARLKDTYFRDVQNVQDEIACNGRSLRQFSNLYRDRIASRQTAAR